MLSPVNPQSSPKSAQRPRVSSGPHAQRQHQHPGKEKRGERCIPYPADGILHGRRVERPDPGRPPGHVPVETASRDLPDRQGRQGGKQAIEGENHPCRQRAEDAEQLEDSGQKQGKERSHPCGRAGVSAKGIGEAVAGGQRASDPPHLFAEQHVVVVGPDAIGMRQGEVEHAHGEGYPEDQPRRTEWFSGGLGRSGYIAFGHRGSGIVVIRYSIALMKLQRRANRKAEMKEVTSWPKERVRERDLRI